MNTWIPSCGSQRPGKVTSAALGCLDEWEVDLTNLTWLIIIISTTEPIFLGHCKSDFSWLSLSRVLWKSTLLALKRNTDFLITRSCSYALGNQSSPWFPIAEFFWLLCGFLSSCALDHRCWEMHVCQVILISVCQVVVCSLSSSPALQVRAVTYYGGSSWHLFFRTVTASSQWCFDMHKPCIHNKKERETLNKKNLKEHMQVKSVIYWVRVIHTSCGPCCDCSAFSPSTSISDHQNWL